MSLRKDSRKCWIKAKRWFAGTSCGVSAPSAPPWTSWLTATPGPCWSTWCSSASTPSPPAVRTPSAPCRRSPATSATSSTTERSAFTVWVRLQTRPVELMLHASWPELEVIREESWRKSGLKTPACCHVNRIYGLLTVDSDLIMFVVKDSTSSVRKLPCVQTLHQQLIFTSFFSSHCFNIFRDVHERWHEIFLGNWGRFIRSFTLLQLLIMWRLKPRQKSLWPLIDHFS